MKFDSVKSVLLLAAVGGAAFVAWRTYKAGAGVVSGIASGVTDAAQTVGTWINPVSDQNLAYRGVNAVGGALVGASGNGVNADGSWTLGGWLYDITHADPLAAPKPVYNSTTIAAADLSDARQIDRIIERQQASIGGLSGEYDAMGNYTGGYTGSW